MTLSSNYASPDAYIRQCEAQRKAIDRANASHMAAKENGKQGVVIDADYHEVDVSAAGDVRLIAANRATDGEVK